MGLRWLNQNRAWRLSWNTWRGMMAKNDEIRQNLIPLSKQYMTLAAGTGGHCEYPGGLDHVITVALMTALLRLR